MNRTSSQGKPEKKPGADRDPSLGWNRRPSLGLKPGGYLAFVLLLTLALTGRPAAAQSIAGQAGPPSMPGPAPTAMGGAGGTLIPAPDPRLAALGSATGPLDPGTLVDTALIVSGLSDQVLQSWRIGIEAALAPIREAAALKPDPKARAEALLELLHERGPFHDYSATATTLIDVFNQGKFNCVSSAVVYLIAARELGIPCAGVRTSDHAFCSVTIGGNSIDVETTTTYGFDPGTKRQFTDAFGKVTGYSYVPPGDYTRRETIDDRRLLSLILSNRAALLESAGHWGEALSLAVDYDAMEPDAESRDFVLGRVNNLAAALMRNRDWTDALRLANEARLKWGDDKRLAAIATTAADGSLVEELSHVGKSGGLTFAEALDLVAKSRASGDVSAARAKEFFAFLYGNEANRIGNSGDWLGAAALAEEGLARTGGDARLAQAVTTFRHNFVVSVHNDFARLFNAQRFKEAAQAASAGLARMPGDPTLSADLKAAVDAGG